MTENYARQPLLERGEEPSQAANSIVAEHMAQVIPLAHTLEIAATAEPPVTAEPVQGVQLPDDPEDADTGEGTQNFESLPSQSFGDDRFVKSHFKDALERPLLSAEEEVELAKRIEAGLFAGEKIRRANTGETRIDAAMRRDLERLEHDGKRAKDHLTEANLRFVISTAKRYIGRGLPFIDLIQEGSAGLVEGIDRFDYTQGNRLVTYASWWINKSIKKAIAEQARTIRIPRDVAEDINKLYWAGRRLEPELERDPTVEELSAHLEWSVDKVVELQKVKGQEPTSLNTPLGESEDSELSDIIIDDDTPDPTVIVGFRQTQDKLEEVLNTLDERERKIIIERFGLHDGIPKALDKLGKEFGVSSERIRQIEAKTLDKLRHPTRRHLLEGLLD